MKLAILCPSRGRPEMARRMQDSFSAIADVIFYLDADDPQAHDYEVFKSVLGPTVPITYAYNILWKEYPGYDAYGLLGDDAVCRSPNLVETLDIRSRAYPHGIWAAGAADGRGDGNPHPVVSARWAKTLGYVIPPIFLHWYGDSRTNDLAKAAGVYVDISPTVLIEHQTPKTGKNPVDDTFRRIRAPLRHERDTFVASFQRWFDADLETLMRAIHE